MLVGDPHPHAAPLAANSDEMENIQSGEPHTNRKARENELMVGSLNKT